MTSCLTDRRVERLVHRIADVIDHVDGMFPVSLTPLPFRLRDKSERDFVVISETYCSMEQASKNSLEQYRVSGAHPDAAYYMIPNIISAAEEELHQQNRATRVKPREKVAARKRLQGTATRHCSYSTASSEAS